MSDKSVNHRLTKLEKSVSSLELAISQPRQSDQTSVSKQADSGQENDAADRQSALHSEIPPTPDNSAQPKKPWYKTMNGWKTLLEVIGIPFAIGYAVVTFCQWRDLRHNFQVDQRAWVSIQIKPITHSVGAPLIVTVQYTNPGNTPARYVRTCQVVEFMERHKVHTLDYSCPSGKASPGSDNIMPKSEIQRIANGAGPEDPTLPTSQLAPSDDIAISSNEKVIFIVGRIDYKDVFETPHWTTFCSGLLILPPSGPNLPESQRWLPCEKGNEIDDK